MRADRRRGAFGREATRLADGVLDLLTEGGFASDDLRVCFSALFTYVTGYVDPAADADASPALVGLSSKSSTPDR